jgi:hypothetical protein
VRRQDFPHRLLANHSGQAHAANALLETAVRNSKADLRLLSSENPGSFSRFAFANPEEEDMDLKRYAWRRLNKQQVGAARGILRQDGNDDVRLPGGWNGSRRSWQSILLRGMFPEAQEKSTRPVGYVFSIVQKEKFKLRPVPCCLMKANLLL